MMVELKSIIKLSEEDVPSIEKKIVADGDGQMNGNLPIHYVLHAPTSGKQDLPMVEKPRGKWQIFKNLGVLSFGFLMLFLAFQSLSNLQSSINAEEGMGTISLSFIYGALVASCLLVPAPAIRLLGLKYTLIISMLLYATYFIANLYPRWWTFISSSILLGIGGAPLWTSKCAYLTQLAGEYATLMGDRSDLVVGTFFGFFFMVFQTGQVWGNLISYIILKPGGGSSTNNTGQENVTCGVRFCPYLQGSANNTNLARPDEGSIQLLVGVYTACAIGAAILLLAFLDPLKRPECASTPGPWYRLLVATVKHLRYPHQVLLIPLTIFSGLSQAFIVGDFTQAYVACAWGVHNIGYVMICFGVMDALGSISFGPLVRRVGRVPLFLMGTLGNLGMIALMALRDPSQEEPWIFFIVAGVWGLGDAVWQTQINALYGILFPSQEEASFANYRLWESLGFIIAFAYSKFVCTGAKLGTLTGTLLVGMAGYLYIEATGRKVPT